MPQKSKKLLLIAISATVCATTVVPALSHTAAIPGKLPTHNYLQENAVDGKLEKAISIASIGAIALVGLGLMASILSGKNRQQLELNLKNTEKLLISQQQHQKKACRLATIDGEKTPDPEDFQIVARDLIESYHTQALAQATSQYWFSVIAASFGFAIILYAAISALRSQQPQIALLNAIPGLAIEGVAVLFLTQADGTRKRATELYDRLRSDEKQLNAIALIESIQDEKLRDVVKAQLGLQIVGITSQALDFDRYSSSHIPPQNSRRPERPDLPEMTDRT